jgi:phosphohistidine phosphatase SixA
MKTLYLLRHAKSNWDNTSLRGRSIPAASAMRPR